ncbi:Replication factor [Salix suchowensis]|nr:Replication factor [Salix suchowensis]
MGIVLDYVARRVGFDLPPDVASHIIEDAAGNMRKALLVLEALKMQSYVLGYLDKQGLATDGQPCIRSPDLSGNLSIAKPDWETYCHKVADLIVQEQTPARVMEVRAKFYELLSHCIPPTVILKTVAERVVERVDEALKADIMHWAAFYVRMEVRMRVGSKKIFHLEAWVVKVMSLYKVSASHSPDHLRSSRASNSFMVHNKSQIAGQPAYMCTELYLEPILMLYRAMSPRISGSKGKRKRLDEAQTSTIYRLADKTTAIGHPEASHRTTYLKETQKKTWMERLD